VNWSEEIRLRRLIQLLGALVAFSLLITRSLWASSTRLFPKAPIFDQLIEIPFSIEIVVWGITICVAIALVFYPSKFKLILPLIILIVLQCVFDQIRIQPWLYLYLLLLFPLWLAKNHDYYKQQWLMSLVRFVVIALYMWSGIHKINPEYWDYTHGFILAPIIQKCPDDWSNFWNASGYAVPFIEMALGILFLFKYTRNWACVGTVFMHLVILLCIGPFGNNWNMVVWPWNIGMMLIVWLLFYKVEWEINWRDIISGKRKYVVLVFCFLLYVAPALNLVGLWDNYLSFSLYSGKTKSLHIYVHETAITKLEPSLQKLLVTNSNLPTFRVLLADTWSFDELGVPVYPQRRIYMNTAQQVCGGSFLSKELFFLITNKSGKGKIEQLRCDQLE